MDLHTLDLRNKFYNHFYRNDMVFWKQDNSQETSVCLQSVCSVTVVKTCKKLRPGNVNYLALACTTVNSIVTTDSLERVGSHKV